MPTKINAYRGSKRRIKNIRWKRNELVSLALLLLVTSIASVWIVLWVESINVY